MTDRAAERPHLKRLADLLAVPVSELAFLAELEPARVQWLATAVSRAIRLEQAPLWASLASAARLLPHRLSARLAQTALGPRATAQIAVHLPPPEVAGVARHVELPFLAAVTDLLAPADVAPLLGQLPLRTLRLLVRHLLSQGAYQPLGEYTAYLPAERLQALVGEIADPADLLQIAAHAPRPEALAGLVAAFDDAQLQALLRTAHALALWPVVLQIGQALPPDELARLGQLARCLQLTEAAAAAAMIRELQLELPLGPLWHGLTGAV